MRRIPRTGFATDGLLVALLLAFFAAVLFLLLRNPTSLDDGLRHFAMARRMVEDGILAVPGWSAFLYRGYLSQTTVDPWFLSDLLLLPLTGLQAHVALKIFVLLQLAVLCTGALLLLRSFGLSPALRRIFLLILVFGDQQFLGRLMLGRPFGLMTGMSLLVLYALLKRKGWLTAMLLATCVLLSQLFVFPLALACARVAWLFLQRRGREASALVCAIACGVLTGFALHPHASAYLRYLIQAFLHIPFLKSIGLSPEMQAGAGDLSMMSVAIVLASATLCAFLRMQNPESRGEWWRSDASYLAGVALALFCAFLAWLRALDVSWPIAVILLARTFSPEPPGLRKLWSALPTGPLWKWSAIILIILQISVVPVTFFRDDVSKSLVRFDALRAIPAGERVLNLDWTAFFAYVAVRPDVRFATGIDPSFTYLTDPEVAMLLRDMRDDAPTFEISETARRLRRLLELYPADVIVVPDHGFQAVGAILDAMPGMRRMAEGPAVVVYRPVPGLMSP